MKAVDDSQNTITKLKKENYLSGNKYSTQDVIKEESEPEKISICTSKKNQNNSKINNSSINNGTEDDKS